MIPIPYKLNFTAELEGKTLKDVECEECGDEFVYLLTRRALGEGTSILFLDNRGASQRAHDRAESRLHEKLDRACEPVPCPQCGWYQRHMLRRARKVRFRWLKFATIGIFFFLVILTGVVGVITIPSAQPIVASPVIRMAIRATAAGAGILLFFWIVSKWVARFRYDPNTEDVETRIATGKRLTMSKQEMLNKLDGRDSGGQDEF